MKKFSPPKMKEVSFPTPHTPHPTPSFKSGDYFYLFFPLPHFPTSPFPHFPISPLPHFPTSPFPHFPISPFPHFPTSPLPHFPISPFPHFPISPLPHFPTPHTLHPTPHFTTRSSTIECSAKAIGY